MKLSEKQQAILGVLSPGFGGTKLPDYIKDYLASGLGAITLFGSNTPDANSAASVIQEIRAINPDCIISIDEECGDVTRIWAKSGSPFPSPYLLGRLSDLSFTEDVFENLGHQLANLDIDLTFAPVLDLSVSKENPIVGVRSFGEDGRAVADQAKAAIRGLSRAGVSSAPKHFPGHGKTAADSHLDLPSINASLEELIKEDLLPFVAAIEDNVAAIMVGHLVVPEVDTQPASLSPIWINDILRETLNFNGVVVTDALDMGALGGIERIPYSSIAAIRAGANLLCLSGVDDQSEILQEILDLADSELNESDLSKISASTNSLKNLRRAGFSKSTIADFDTSVMASAFEIQGEPRLEKGTTAVLSLGADPTIASGNIHWGIEGSLVEKGQAITTFDTAKNLIVQFRDAWRDQKVLDRLMMLKVNHPSAIFIDFGWPTTTFQAKNLIRTFGATLAHSKAATDYLLRK